MRRTFKYRIYPTKTQLVVLNRMFAGARNLYNAALEQRQMAWKYRKIAIGYYDQCKELRAARDADLDLGLVPSQVCQQVVKRLDRAFSSFFRRIKSGETPGYPRFKSSDRFNSITFSQYLAGVKLTDKLYVQNVGKVRIKLHRPIEGRIKTVTIKRDAGCWYAFFSCDDVPVRIYPNTVTEVGIDVGLSIFATLSTGDPIHNPRWYRKAEVKLRIAHQELSRKQRHSKRRAKAKLRVSRLYAKVANQRHDFHHKEARKIVVAHAFIAVEDLDVKSLVEMKTRPGLSKSIYDAGWGQFLSILSDKAEEAGRKFVKVPPRGTSSTCSQCGAHKQKALSERLHVCHCGSVLDRDVNASLNILRLGRSLQGCIA